METPGSDERDVGKYYMLDQAGEQTPPSQLIFPPVVFCVRCLSHIISTTMIFIVTHLHFVNLPSFLWSIWLLCLFFPTSTSGSICSADSCWVISMRLVLCLSEPSNKVG